MLRTNKKIVTNAECSPQESLQSANNHHLPHIEHTRVYMTNNYL